MSRPPELNAGLKADAEDIERVERGEEEQRHLHSALEEKENAKLQLEALEGQNRLLDNKLAEIESQVAQRQLDSRAILTLSAEARSE
jgi:hypothetical protein